MFRFTSTNFVNPLMPNKFFIQHTLLSYNKVESTNTAAMTRIKSGEAHHGDIIRANYQLGGKGQGQNTWYSTEGNNLLVSFICTNLKLNASKLAVFNMLVATSTYSVINRYFPNRTALKWPNDILVNDKKIAGILIETILQGEFIKHAVIGIGINVNEQVFPFAHAVSFTQLSGLFYNLDNLLHELTEQLNLELQKLYTSSFDSIKRDYETVLYGMNLKRYFRIENLTFEGIIKGINAQGQLCIEVDNEMKTFNQKEIKFDFAEH